MGLLHPVKHSSKFQCYHSEFISRYMVNNAILKQVQDDNITPRENNVFIQLEIIICLCLFKMK